MVATTEKEGKNILLTTSNPCGTNSCTSATVQSGVAVSCLAAWALKSELTALDSSAGDSYGMPWCAAETERRWQLWARWSTSSWQTHRCQTVAME